ncbi:hypothetical protein ACF0H5_011460 [Mactra antiquata]
MQGSPPRTINGLQPGTSSRLPISERFGTCPFKSHARCKEIAFDLFISSVSDRILHDTKMNCGQIVSAVPKLVHRRFSTGSLQYIKQCESEGSTATLKWERTMKSTLALVSIAGLSFSAINTRNMYDSRERFKVQCQDFRQ